MTKIRTILQGFVDINLETDEKKATKIGADEEVAIIQDNLKSTVLGDGVVLKTSAINLQPPISLNQLSEEIGVTSSSIQFAITQGSRVYGVDTNNSDWDITVVSSGVDGYRFVEFSYEGIDYDVNVYSSSEFQSRIDRHEMKELEILYYPREAILLQTIEFNTQLNRTQLINTVREESDQLWYRAKFGLDSKQDAYQPLKTIWHSIRFLIFAEQILRFGSIENFSAANVLRSSIVNSNRVDFEYFDSNFGALREAMKVEIGRHIGEKTLKVVDKIQTSPSEEVKVKYAVANFQGFYVQKGGVTPNVEMRYVTRNTISEYEDDTWRMFIKFGDYIEQNWRTFNPPSTSRTAPICGENCISGYDQSLRSDNFQRNSKIFFGKNPDTNSYGDLKIRIKNVGSHSAEINGFNLAVEESVTIDINKFNWSIKLPSNSRLVSAGTFVDEVLYNSNTLIECLYEFTFEVGYEEFGFKLRNFDNSVSNKKEFNLGVHRFIKTYSSEDADNSINYYNLLTEYSNVWPYWESDFKWPKTEPYCIAPGNDAIPNPVYPVDKSNLKNVVIDGIAFLHQSEIDRNSQNTSKTQYMNIGFHSDGKTAASSGCTSVNIQNTTGVYAPQLQTSSIPFLVI